MNDTLWERRECVSAEVEDSLVLLDMETLVYHSLNKTAAAIWESLGSPKTATQITDELCEKFAVPPSVCRASVDRMLLTMQEQTLVAPKSTAGGAAITV